MDRIVIKDKIRTLTNDASRVVFLQHMAVRVCGKQLGIDNNKVRPYYDPVF